MLLPEFFGGAQCRRHFLFQIGYLSRWRSVISTSSDHILSLSRRRCSTSLRHSTGPIPAILLSADRTSLACRVSAAAHYRNERVGFIFQSYNLLPRLTALENILVPMLPKRRSDPGRAQELLDAVGLGDRGRHRPSELSGGEQQRVVIARAVVNDPAIILADEPTGNLDDDNARKIADPLSKACRERGKTLILVTDDRNLIHPADRVFDASRISNRPRDRFRILTSALAMEQRLQAARNRRSNRAPRGTQSLTVMLAPCALTISITIAKPSPAPLATNTFAAPEALEDVRPILGRDARTAVLDADRTAGQPRRSLRFPGAVCASAFSIRLRSASAIAAALPVTMTG